MPKRKTHSLDVNDATLSRLSIVPCADAIRHLRVGDELSWEFDLAAAGSYGVYVEQAAGKPVSQVAYELAVNDQLFTCDSVLTRDWRLHRAHRVAEVDIAQAGPCTLKLRPISISVSFFDLKRVVLIPVDAEPQLDVQSLDTQGASDILASGRYPQWSRGLVDVHAANPKIVLHPESTYQRITGIGGFFNEIGADALFSLPESQQQEVLQSLFGDSGANLSYCGFPVGASDFALGAYSLNDHDGDLEMTRFSLDRDEKLLIPYIKAAQKLNPALKFHVRPWGAPYWMKDTADMTTGSLRHEPDIYRAYALYLCKFVEAYAQRDIAVDRLIVQNEPDVANGYPGTIWQADEYAEFVGDYLLPQAREMGIKEEIWAGSFQAIWKLSAHRVAHYEKVRTGVDGFAFQYSPSDYVTDFRLKYPDIRIMHTESPCAGGDNSWLEGLGLYEDIVTYFCLGADVYTYWNMILNGTSRSYKGWKQNSLIVIDKTTGTVTYTPDYHVLKLFAANIAPGSVRIDAFAFGKRILAVTRPDGAIVVFIDNLRDAAVSAQLDIAGRLMDVELPASSINAIRISPVPEGIDA